MEVEQQTTDPTDGLPPGSKVVWTSNAPPSNSLEAVTAPQVADPGPHFSKDAFGQKNLVSDELIQKVRTPLVDTGYDVLNQFTTPIGLLAAAGGGAAVLRAAMSGGFAGAGWEAFAQAAPAIKYEVVKTVLERMHVPGAGPIAMVVSSYQGKRGAATATEDAATRKYPAPKPPADFSPSAAPPAPLPLPPADFSRPAATAGPYPAPQPPADFSRPMPTVQHPLPATPADFSRPAATAGPYPAPQPPADFSRPVGAVQPAPLPRPPADFSRPTPAPAAQQSFPLPLKPADFSRNQVSDFVPAESGAPSAATAGKAPTAKAAPAASSPAAGSSQDAAIKVLTGAGMSAENAARAVRTWVKNGIPNLKAYAKEWADEHLD